MADVLANGCRWEKDPESGGVDVNWQRASRPHPIQSLGAKPLRLIGLAWLSSIWLVSTLRGYFLAHSMHVVTPGNASSRAAAMGLSHRLHRLRVDFCFELMTTSRCTRQPLRVRHAIVRPACRGDHRV